MAADKYWCQLISLKCNNNKDVGKDECKLKIIVDGKTHTFKRTMDRGDEWILNYNYNFINIVDVQLWEEVSPPDGLAEGAAYVGSLSLSTTIDAIDGEDFLGNVVIGTNPIINGRGSFTREGANYVLEYAVGKYRFCEKHGYYIRGITIGGVERCQKCLEEERRLKEIAKRRARPKFTKYERKGESPKNIRDRIRKSKRPPKRVFIRR